MRRQCTLGALAVTVCAAASAAPVTWDGTCGGVFWHTTCGPGTQSNWNPDPLPTSSDDVTLGPAQPIVRIAAGTGDARTITCQNGLDVTNGGQLRLTSGFSQVHNLQVINASVGLVGGAVLELQGTSTFGGATITGAGELFNAATVNGLAIGLINAAKFTNGEGAQTTLAQMIVPSGTFLTNNSGGTFTISLPTGVGGITSNGLVVNHGTFIAKHGTNTTINFEAVFQQQGGSFRIRGGPGNCNTNMLVPSQFLDGTIQLEEGGILRFQGPGVTVMDGVGTITGQGNVYIETFGGPINSDWQVLQPLTVSLSGIFSSFLISGARMTLGADLTNTGNMIWVRGRIQRTACEGCSAALVNNSSQFAIDTGSAFNGVVLDLPLNNLQVITHFVGALTLDDEGVVLNTGEYELKQGDIRRVSPTVSGQFRNQGSLIKPDTFSVSDSSISAICRLEPSSTTTVNKAKLTFTEGGLKMEGGDISVGPAGTVSIGGGIHVASSGDPTTISGLGRFEIAGGGTASGLRVDLIADVNIAMPGTAPAGFHMVSGRLGGEGEIRSFGNSYWSGGIIGVANGTVPLSANVYNQGNAFITGMTVEGLGSTFTNAAGATAHVSGGVTFSLNGFIVNAGNWRFNLVDGQTINVSGGQGLFKNDFGATMTAKSPPSTSATVTISTPFGNSGTLVVEGRTSVSVGDSQDIVRGATGDRLEFGKWIVQPTGKLSFPGHTIRELGSGVEVDGESVSLPNFNLSRNDGHIRATGPLNSTGPVENRGGMTAESPGSITTPGGIDNGPGTADHEDDDHLTGAPVVTGGFTCASFNNNAGGFVRPGGPDAPGPFKVTGNFNQSRGGMTQIELAGPSPVDSHDQVIVTGNVSLGGELHVTTLDGYVPPIGQQFTILTASGTISGQFESITGLGQFSVDYQPHAVVLTTVIPPNPADLSGDGHVNGIDLGLMLGQWTGAATYSPCPPFTPADLNQDCKVNGLDLAILLAAWAP